MRQWIVISTNALPSSESHCGFNVDDTSEQEVSSPLDCVKLFPFSTFTSATSFVDVFLFLCYDMG